MRSLYLAVYFFLTVSAVFSFSAPILSLSGSGDFTTLGGYLALREDPQGLLTFEEVRDLPQAFELVEDDFPNRGFSTSVWWVRFQVDYRLTEDKDFILEANYPPLEYLTLYTVQEDGTTGVQTSGGQLAVSHRPLSGMTFGFPLEPSEGVVQYYLRFETSSVVQIPLKIWEYQAFRDHQVKRSVMVGLYFGLHIVMILYNLFIFISIRDRAYLYYVLFVLLTSLFNVAMLGAGSLYLWPAHPSWSPRLLIMGASLALVFNSLFTKNFLRIEQGRVAPLVMKTILIITFVNASIAVFLSYRAGIISTNLLLFINTVAFFVLGIVRYVQGFKPAYFYLLAWSGLLFAAFVTALMNFGFLPHNAFTENVIQYGFAFNATLLSLAITDRINYFRRGLIEARNNELKAVEQQLYFDNLTKLPNRNRLIQDIYTLENPRLFLINMDGFRRVNDYYGNQVGDKVILQMRDRMALLSTPWKRTIYRLHADEFALVLDAPLEEIESEILGKKLSLATRHEPFDVDGQQVRIDVSVGVASQKGKLLEHADMALVEARRSQVGVSVYNAAMKTYRNYENNIRLTGILKDIIGNNRIIPFFQPIQDNGTGANVKHECLMRLEDNEGNLMPPGEILEVARLSRLYPELSRLMMRHTFDVITQFSGEFSLNISVDDILQKETLSFLRSRLEGDLAPRITFEILESEGFESYEIVINFIDEMQERGCLIAIDDFGTGYSNFSHIMKLKVNYLKIDSSLIRSVHKDAQAYTVVGSIQEFASHLGLQTVAEYVHSKAVLQVVKELGIPYSQGYYIGKPQPRPQETPPE